MSRGGIAEEVVHVAENLLIGADEEDADVVRLVLAQGVDRQHVGLTAIDGEVGHLTVAVAGDIL